MFCRLKQLRGQFSLLGLAPLLLIGLAFGCGKGEDNEETEGESQAEMVLKENGLTLTETERKYLWDCEHHGTLLNLFGFKPMANAIIQSDVESLTQFLSSDFEAFVPEQTDAVEFESEYVSANRSTTREDGYRQIDGSQFVDWIIEQRDAFDSEPKVKFSLMALHPIDREDFDSQWEGSFRLRIWGRGKDQGFAEKFLYMSMELVRPEANAKAQQWLKSIHVNKSKSAHSPQMLLADVTEEWGFDRTVLHDNWDHKDSTKLMPNPGGVFTFDYNRDGCVDVLVTDLTLPQGFLFYEGSPSGKMKDVTSTIGLRPTRAGMVCVADLDNDGWEDLVLNNDAVFRNNDGQGFKEVSYRTNLWKLISDQQALGLSVSVADYDLDGLVDLYFSRGSSEVTKGSWIDGKIGDVYQNMLLKNVGDWQFEDVTETSGTNGGKRSTFSSVWLDANSDGYPDLYAIHEFGNGLLMINQQDGTFAPSNLVQGLGDFGSMGVTCGDVNNDNKIDIYVGSMYSKSGNRVMGNLKKDAYEPEVMEKLKRMVAGSRLYLNHSESETTSFDRVGPELDITEIGWAYGPAMFDLNNDGLLDIYATAGFVSRDASKPDG